MALNLNESIIEHKIDIPLDPAYLGPLESGMIMVASGAGAGGQQLARPCTGAAGEVVLGALKLSENSQESVPTLEDLTVPAQPTVPVLTFSLTLRELPTAVAAVRAVVIADPSGALAAGDVITVVAGAPGAGQIGVNLATGALTIDAALAEVSFRVVYRFAISAQELARRGGRRSVNMGAERIFNQVTIMRGDCKLLISNFNTGAAVAPNVNLTCGAGGSVTVGGTGTVVGFCFQAPVLKLTPGIEQAFIGLEANLGG
jgi:hypothetical protein